MSASPTQENIALLGSADFSRTYTIMQPGEAIVSVEALSGATTIRVHNLHLPISSGDPLILAIKSPSFEGQLRVFASANVAAGQASGQKYQDIPISPAIDRHIPKDTILLIPRDVSTGSGSTFDYELRNGVYKSPDDSNKVASTQLNVLDDGTAAERGKIQIKIPYDVRKGLAPSLTDYNGQTIDVWKEATLPTLAMDDTTHTHRHALVEIVGGDRVVLFQGVVVVGELVATGDNDGGG